MYAKCPCYLVRYNNIMQSGGRAHKERNSDVEHDHEEGAGVVVEGFVPGVKRMDATQCRCHLFSWHQVPPERMARNIISAPQHRVVNERSCNHSVIVMHVKMWNMSSSSY